MKEKTILVLFGIILVCYLFYVNLMSGLKCGDGWFEYNNMCCIQTGDIVRPEESEYGEWMIHYDKWCKYD